MYDVENTTLTIWQGSTICRVGRVCTTCKRGVLYDVGVEVSIVSFKQGSMWRLGLRRQERRGRQRVASSISQRWDGMMQLKYSGFCGVMPDSCDPKVLGPF